MGRSVSYPGGAIVAFRHYDESWYCMECEEESDNSTCPKCGADLNSDGVDWDGEIDFLRDWIKELFPSFEPCDKWLGREDHAIAENRFAYFGISEYCGLVSIWLVKKGDFEHWSYSYDDNLYGLASRWLEQVEKRFLSTFGTLRKLGSFSNGEGVYERV